MSFLLVGTLHWSEIKFLIGSFTGVPIMNFILDCESEIVNPFCLQTFCLGKLMLLPKNESFLERKQLH